jgi:isoleucyl-tRNA synthetase
VDGNEIELGEEDLLIEMTKQEGFESLGEGSITVVLDTKLTPELIEEGFVREIVSKVQTMRKEADFEVMDRIVVYAKDNDKIAKVLEDNKDAIMKEVLANDIVVGSTDGYVKDWNINGEDVTLGVKKQ